MTDVHTPLSALFLISIVGCFVSFGESTMMKLKRLSLPRPLRETDGVLRKFDVIGVSMIFAGQRHQAAHACVSCWVCYSKSRNANRP